MSRFLLPYGQANIWPIVPPPSLSHLKRGKHSLTLKFCKEFNQTLTGNLILLPESRRNGLLVTTDAWGSGHPGLPQEGAGPALRRAAEEPRRARARLHVSPSGGDTA